MKNAYLTLSPDTIFHLLLLDKTHSDRIDAIEAVHPMTELLEWRIDVLDLVLDCIAVMKEEYIPSLDITKEPDITVYSRKPFLDAFEESEATEKGIKEFLNWANKEVMLTYKANPNKPIVALKREYGLARVVLEHLKWRRIVTALKAVGVEITWADSINLLAVVYQELGKEYSPLAETQMEEGVKGATFAESLSYIEWVKSTVPDQS